MQIYEVRISHGVRIDMAELRKFLKAMMINIYDFTTNTSRGSSNGVT